MNAVALCSKMCSFLHQSISVLNTSILWGVPSCSLVHKLGLPTFRRDHCVQGSEIACDADSVRVIFHPIMKLEAKIISETSVLDYQTTRRHGPADGRLRIYGRENSSFHSFRSCLHARRKVLGIQTYADNAVYPDVCRQCVLSIRKLAVSFSLFSDIRCFLSLYPEAVDSVPCVSGHIQICILYPDRCGQCLLPLRIFADVFSVFGHVLCIRTVADNVSCTTGQMQFFLCGRPTSNSNQHDESCP